MCLRTMDGRRMIQVSVLKLSEHLKLCDPFDFVVAGVTPLVDRDACRISESRIEFHLHLVGIAVNGSSCLRKQQFNRAQGRPPTAAIASVPSCAPHDSNPGDSRNKRDAGIAKTSERDSELVRHRPFDIPVRAGCVQLLEQLGPIGRLMPRLGRARLRRRLGLEWSWRQLRSGRLEPTARKTNNHGTDNSQVAHC